MTDEHLLNDLSQLYSAQADVALQMSLAINYFDRDMHQNSWHRLFSWCLARDERDELWKGIEDHYFDAVLLREGHR